MRQGKPGSSPISINLSVSPKYHLALENLCPLTLIAICCLKVYSPSICNNSIDSMKKGSHSSTISHLRSRPWIPVIHCTREITECKPISLLSSRNLMKFLIYPWHTFLFSELSWIHFFLHFFNCHFSGS